MAEADRKADILDSIPHVPAHVVYRSFEGETLLLNLDSGEYHCLNETGGRLLELLKACTTLREAIATLATEYGVDASAIEPEMADFCRSLAARGLVDLAPAGRVGA